MTNKDHTTVSWQQGPLATRDHDSDESWLEGIDRLDHTLFLTYLDFKKNLTLILLWLAKGK